MSGYGTHPHSVKPFLQYAKFRLPLVNLLAIIVIILTLTLGISLPQGYAQDFGGGSSGTTFIDDNNFTPDGFDPNQFPDGFDGSFDGSGGDPSELDRCISPFSHDPFFASSASKNQGLLDMLGIDNGDEDLLSPPQGMTATYEGCALLGISSICSEISLKDDGASISGTAEFYDETTDFRVAIGSVTDATFDSNAGTLTLSFQVQVTGVPDSIEVVETCQVSSDFQTLSCPTLGSLRAGGDLDGVYVGTSLIGFTPLEITLDSEGLFEGTLTAEMTASLFGNVVATASVTGVEGTNEAGERTLAIEGVLTLTEGEAVPFSDTGVVSPDGESITFELLGMLTAIDDDDFGPEFGPGFDQETGGFPGPSGSEQFIGPPPFDIIDEGLLIAIDPDRFPMRNGCQIHPDGFVICPTELFFLEASDILPPPFGEFFPSSAGFKVINPADRRFAIDVPPGFGVLAVGPRPRSAALVPRIDDESCPDVPFIISDQLYINYPNPDDAPDFDGVRVFSDGFVAADPGSFFTIQEFFGDLGSDIVALFGSFFVGLEAEFPDGLLRLTDRQPRPRPRSFEDVCPVVMSEGFIAVLDFDAFGELPPGVGADERGFLFADDSDAFFPAEDILPQECIDSGFLGPIVGFFPDFEFGLRLRATDQPFIAAPERTETPFDNIDGFLVILNPDAFNLPPELTIDDRGFVRAPEADAFYEADVIIPPEFLPILDRFFGFVVGFFADRDFGNALRSTDRRPNQGPEFTGDNLHIRLEPPDMGLRVGESQSFQIFGQVLPNEPEQNLNGFPADWSSSDPGVANVDQFGNVTALAPGFAEIKVLIPANSITDGQPDLIGFGFINVEGDGPTATGNFTGFEISPREAFLSVGDVINLFAASSTGEDVSDRADWSSSDSSVATVDGRGTVVAVGPGQTIIQVFFDGFSATAFINVEGNGTTLTNPDGTPFDATVEFKIEPADMVLEVGQSASFSLFASTGEFVNNFAQWTSEFPSMVSVDNFGNVTALAPGASTITAFIEGRAVTAHVTTIAGVLTTTTDATGTLTGSGGIQIVPTAPIVQVGSSIQLSVFTVAGIDVTNQVAWNVADPSLASIDSNGVVTGLSPGLTQILVIFSTTAVSMTVVTSLEVLP